MHKKTLKKSKRAIDVMGTKYSGPQKRVSGHRKKSESCLRRDKCGLFTGSTPPRKQQGSTQKFKDYCKSEENTAEVRGLML